MGSVCSLCSTCRKRSREINSGYDSNEDLINLSLNGGYGVEFLRIVPNLRFEGKELGCGLFQSLGVCKALSVLQLINCTGVCNFHLISQINTLQALSIDGNVKFLNMSALSSLSNVRMLAIENNSILHDEDMPDFGSLSKLEALDITSCSLVTTVKGLQDLPALFGVNLSGTSVTDETIKELTGCPILKVVQLLNCKQLTNVSPLGSIATLEVLDISGCENVKEFGNIGCNSKLRLLGLAGCAITDEFIKSISVSSTLKRITLNTCIHITDVSPLKSIPTLQGVLLDFCKNVTNIGIMGKFPQLSVLSVAGTSVTDEDIKEFGESGSLIKVFLTCCELITDISPLGSIETLEEVNVFGCEGLNNILCLAEVPGLKVLYLKNSTSANSLVEEISKARDHVKVIRVSSDGRGDVTEIKGTGELPEITLVLSDEPPLY